MTTTPKFRRYKSGDAIDPVVREAVKQLITDGMPARAAAELIVKAWREQQDVTAFAAHVIKLRQAAKSSTKLPIPDPLGLHDDFDA